ncbi:MAG: N-6 DNA methylase [Gemmataceae bacterium]|nr:N-6 DNA methylase [Gemmataceae bacterium]
MNFIDQESPQKLRGGYYTDPDIAAFLARWALEIRPRRILEPACGDGAFLAALARLAPKCLKAVEACELDPVEAAKARAQALPGADVAIHVTDFLHWSLAPARKSVFDAVLGNPPFIRYQYLNDQQQTRAERIFQRHALDFTRHTNAWVPFVIAALALLRPGGRLAMVLPAELLHVLHAQPLRQFLLAECSRILVLDPEDLWFGDALQGVVLLLAEKRCEEQRSLAELAILALPNRLVLTAGADIRVGNAEFLPGPMLDGKWMVGLLSRNERQLLDSLSDRPHVYRFGEVASVDVGIVTGANHFFLVSDDVVRAHGLEHWAHPMFGRSEHVQGVVYDRARHEANRSLGLRANFLWFGDVPMNRFPPGVRRYLRAGEAEGLHRRYKCRIRTPWYNVPSVSTAPVAMLKRCHHFPRLVLNRARAFTTDTAYRIHPRGISAARLVAAFVNSLTALSSELEGRHYGGGVLELVPSEIEHLLLAIPNNAGALLAGLDRAVCKGTTAEALMIRQDQAVLQSLGITASECATLRQAWTRLRTRRHRKTRTPPND